MKSPFENFVDQHVRVELKNGGSCAGKLSSIKDGWLTLEDTSGSRVVREDDITGVRAEKILNLRFAFNVHIGRISHFDPESNSGHIQESWTGRDWHFSDEIVRDNLLKGKLLQGETNQLVKFMPATDFTQRSGLKAGEVKAVSHHALKAKSALMRWMYERTSLALFMIKNQRRRILSREFQGFVCDFNRRKALGQIREEGSDALWSFYGNDIADKDLFNRIYAGELGMQVLFSGYKRTAPGKISDARNVRGLEEPKPRSSGSAEAAIRTATGRITAYYVDRGFGFVKESQSDQIWYFSRQALAVDMQLQSSLMRGDLNQFVTFSGKPQPTPGHEYPAIDSMHGAQAPVDDSVAQPQGESYFDAWKAEKRGDFQLAEGIYRKLLHDHATDNKANVVKGYAYLLNRLNRANEAIDLIEGNRALLDAKARLGMLSIFFRKACRYTEAADTFKQMALNIGLPKEDEKRISYLFQGAECFCEGGDFESARDLLDYLPAEFDRNDPRYATAVTRVKAGMKTKLGAGFESPGGDANHQRKRFGFQYPALAQERLATCKYTGLNPTRLVEGNFRQTDIKEVFASLKASADLPPSMIADYHLTMAKLADDIGDSAIPYLYRHFLYRAVDAVNPPRMTREEVLCEVVQAFNCAGSNRFLLERLWYVAIWAFCGSGEPIPTDGIRRKFNPGSLIQAVLDRIKADPGACSSLFQVLGIVHRNIPEEGFTYLVESLKKAGWQNCEELISQNDRYLGVEEPFADLLGLESVDESSLIGILSRLTSIGGLPSALDQENCNDFADLLRQAAKYASQQSNFIKCTESFNQFQLMAKSLVEKPQLSVLSVCLMKPAVRNLMERVGANYNKHRSLRPELVLSLRHDDPEARTCMTQDGRITLRFRVSFANEAAPQVHNLLFAVSGADEGGTASRAEYTWPTEFSGGAVDFSLPSFKVSEEERRLGEFSIEVSVSYDTLLGEHCDCTHSFAVRLASESSTWEEISPNPYRAAASGSLVRDDNMFFGRAKLVADIAEVLRHPNGGQCFVLYGQKRSGKSSVLEAVCRRLIHSEERCIISSISAQSLVVKGSRGPLFARFAIMLYSRLKTEFGEHRIQLPEGFPTKEEIDNNPMDAVERFAKALRDEGFFWVLAVDEFTAIHRESPDVVTTFMHNWKAMLQEGLFNALIVGQDTMPKFMDEHPNDFCVSHNIRLSYLTREECHELSSRPIELEGRSRYLENSLDKIYDWTLGSPYLVQKFCCRLVERLNDERHKFVVDADIDGVARSMCFGNERMPEVEFDSFVTAGDEDMADFDSGTLKNALIAVAKESRMTGWVPIDSIVREGDADDGTVSIAAEVIEDLVKRDALERFEGKLKIPVRLFAEWLRINM